MIETKRALTAYEVAMQLGCHVLTVRKAIARGDLRAVRIGRKVLIPVTALDEFLESRPPAAPKAAG